MYAFLSLKQHVLCLCFERLLSSLFSSYFDFFKFQKSILCYVDRLKSLSFIDYNLLHLYNFLCVYLLDYVRHICDLCVVDLFRFLNNSFLVIFVRSKYTLLSQILLVNSNDDVSLCLNLNRCLNLTTINLLQFLTKLLRCLFLFLEVRRSHKWENDRSILYFDFD